MPTNPHPADNGLVSLAAHRRQIIRLFARDGVICTAERAALRVLDEGIAAIAYGRRVERLCDYLLRSEGHVSDYGHELAHDAGYDVIPLHADTTVVHLHTDPDDAA